MACFNSETAWNEKWVYIHNNGWCKIVPQVDNTHIHTFSLSLTHSPTLLSLSKNNNINRKLTMLTTCPSPYSEQTNTPRQRDPPKVWHIGSHYSFGQDLYIVLLLLLLSIFLLHWSGGIRNTGKRRWGSLNSQRTVRSADRQVSHPIIIFEVNKWVSWLYLDLRLINIHFMSQVNNGAR